MFKKIIYILLVIIFTFALFGCGASKPAAPAGEGEAASGDVSIKVTGKVDNEKTWTEDEIKGMKTMEAERANKEGVMETYTGVSINELLNESGVQGDASKVFMVADDGYEAEVALADLQACGNCIVSFITQGGFNSVLPDFPNNVQVKGIVELRVE